MDVTTGRLKHAFRVAEKMKQAVENNPGICKATGDEMFLLGYLHDVGYSFVDRQEDHGRAAGELLKLQGYKFWKEVYFHGTPGCEYSSDEMDLLNWADMTVDQSGRDVTTEYRLSDIGRRYGTDSVQFRQAVRLSEEIKKRFAGV